MCVHLLSTAVRAIAQVYTALLVAGASPQYQFRATMEPGIRQIKFFDTKLQMFESLNFVQKITISQIETSKNIRRTKFSM